MKSRIRTRLCAGCAAKLGKLYHLSEVPAEYARAGYAGCGLCGFRGELTEYSYDPERDRKTPQERETEAKAGAPAQWRRTEEEKQECMFTPADFACLDDALNGI